LVFLCPVEGFYWNTPALSCRIGTKFRSVGPSSTFFPFSTSKLVGPIGPVYRTITHVLFLDPCRFSSTPFDEGYHFVPVALCILFLQKFGSVRPVPYVQLGEFSTVLLTFFLLFHSAQSHVSFWKLNQPVTSFRLLDPQAPALPPYCCLWLCILQDTLVGLGTGSLC